MKRHTNNDVVDSIGNPVVSIHRFSMQMILATALFGSTATITFQKETLSIISPLVS